jgi:hypothetical protein
VIERVFGSGWSSTALTLLCGGCVSPFAPSTLRSVSIRVSDGEHGERRSAQSASEQPLPDRAAGDRFEQSKGVNFGPEIYVIARSTGLPGNSISDPSRWCLSTGTGLRPIRLRVGVPHGYYKTAIPRLADQNRYARWRFPWIWPAGT